MFSGNLFCAKCGRPIIRREAKGIITYFCTAQRRHKRPCGNKPVHEEELKRAFIIMLNKLTFSQSQPTNRIIDVVEEYAQKGDASKSAMQYAKRFKKAALFLCRPDIAFKHKKIAILPILKARILTEKIRAFSCFSTKRKKPAKLGIDHHKCV